MDLVHRAQGQGLGLLKLLERRNSLAKQPAALRLATLGFFVLLLRTRKKAVRKALADRQASLEFGLPFTAAATCRAAGAAAPTLVVVRRWSVAHLWSNFDDECYCKTS